MNIRFNVQLVMNHRVNNHLNGVNVIHPRGSAF